VLLFVVPEVESRSSYSRPPFASDEKTAEILARSFEEINDEKEDGGALSRHPFNTVCSLTVSVSTPSGPFPALISIAKVP
jgi:hypothetical protein